MKQTPKIKMTTSSGTVYYADCSECGRLNFLNGTEKDGASCVCRKCGERFQLDGLELKG